jgi:5-methylcytosine-specific restriction endonuclease McrA
MRLGLSSNHYSGAKQEIIERIKSMVFLCMYCDSPNPIMLSVVNFEYHSSGPYARAFFICPDCHNKFIVKIQDLGKVRK